MKYFIMIVGMVSGLSGAGFAWAEDAFRPPSVPLVVHDPYFSIWSPADKLTDAETVHWTGKKHPLHAMIRIDGKPYRLMGAEPADVPAMEQKSVEIGPLRTTYKFETEDAEVLLIFGAPLVPDDLESMSRPVTYILGVIEGKNGTSHTYSLYFDAGAEIAVNKPDQKVEWKNLDIPTAFTMKLGTQEQSYLNKRGDDVRIDWGHMILSFFYRTDQDPKARHGGMTVGNGEKMRAAFVKDGSLLEENLKAPQRVDEENIAIATVLSLDKPVPMGAVMGILAYDDVYSVRYFGDDLKAWWARDGKTAEQMLKESHIEGLFKIAPGATEFEKSFQENLTAVGGEDYAKLCALAYRHSLGAQKIVADANGMPLMFSKENFSNGSMGTVDLMYPCSPMLLYYSPAMMKATLQPMFDYAETEKWKFPFAPHDIGTYPHGTGQTYGGGEKSEENQMPVEESANMIIMTAALAVAENDPGFAKLHWNTLTKWADYLLDKGFDPENQLCTDDFAGHLAHNVNLSAKAIVAIGAYAQLAEKLGEKEAAAKYRKSAEEFAARWIKEANDGDHFRLAFDKPGCWSMKYNLMWDEILDLKLFPRSVMEKEIAYYKTKMQKYGLPLDNRSLYSKNDWILWTATMTDNRDDFDAFLKPVIGYVNNTPNRVPLSDWYYTDSAKQVGFQARSVVGGFWAPMLKDTKKWQAQAAKGANVPNGGWAEITLPGKTVKVITPTAETEKVDWQYTTDKPAEGWEKFDFDDAAWKTGKSGFGTRQTPGAIIGTVWNTSDIWLRHEFEWEDAPIMANTALTLDMHHDEDVEVYLNGVLICERSGWSTGYEKIFGLKLVEYLKPGKNTLAVHCRQNDGGQYIDVGISYTELKGRTAKQSTARASIKETKALVSGTVTMDGVPVDGATVTFWPHDIANGEKVSGVTNAEGKYTMLTPDKKENIPVGEYRVTVEKTIVKEIGETTDGEMLLEIRHLLPQKYANEKTTPLAMTVMQGKNTFGINIPK